MPEDRILYFAYGSNMSSRRLYSRLPEARWLGAARLEGHALRFHKVGQRDDSGKCDAAPTGDPNDRVWGVVYALSAADLIRLDRIEGRGEGYDRWTVAVVAASGKPVEAQTYVATCTDPMLTPLDWYLFHVIQGAREAALPRDYVAGIETVAAARDPDSARRARELAIYQ